MQTQTINAYVYQQYADDDDIQAFNTGYNGMTQDYVTFFATVGLPIYTGLSGPLLDWVLTGLYGLKRTSLSGAGTAALGPLNTQPLNTAPLNSFTSPPTETFFTLSDDAYKRIATWDLYKGDGKRFCPRWLKRRIMRFCVGTNGIDPIPGTPGFTVGAETTTAINTVIDTATNVVTVTIDQTRLGQQATITPGILQIFQIAFQTQLLDLPIQYTYVCNIVSAVVAYVSPLSASSLGPSPNQTTQVVVVSAYGGTGDYTYTWSFISGGGGISIDAPFSYETTFTGGSMSPGETRSAIAQCIVLDLITLEEAIVLVPVSITNDSFGLLQENGAPLFALNGNPLLLG